MRKYKFDIEELSPRLLLTGVADPTDCCVDDECGWYEDPYLEDPSIYEDPAEYMWIDEPIEPIDVVIEPVTEDPVVYEEPIVEDPLPPGGIVEGYEPPDIDV